MSKVVVIGAGVGGVAVAIRLAVQGYEVEVVEASDVAGGKISEIRGEGFRFDCGPSLFTMPQYVDELFTLAGKSPADHFRYGRLETICKYFYEDGSSLSAFAEPAQFAAEIEARTKDDAPSVLAHLEYSKQIYDITDPVFLQRSLHKISTYTRWSTVKSALQIQKIDPFRTMHQANRARFKDPRVVQLFDRFATYNGSNPYQAPATLNVIPHFEQHFGAYFPEGGMYSIAQKLRGLAEEVGVVFRFGTRVQTIVLDQGRVRGIDIAQGTIGADVVVSNMDVWYTYQHLLRDKVAPPKAIFRERSSSALIFYWGMEGLSEQLDVHNIFFSSDYALEFEDIWSRNTVTADPTVYVHISSKVEPGDAPSGSENWFVMINVPANSGQDWDLIISQARARILAKLSKILSRNLAADIRFEETLDPRGIDRRTSSYQGSLYGTSSNDPFAAFLRHPNYSPEVKGLYFTGGSVHPGGGIPLALLSAKITSEMIGPAM